MLNQQTLREAAHYAGIGLHSGNQVEMTILPAPPNSGIRFRRVDLEGKPEIEAKIENVSETNRSTTLARGNIKIHTVEHVLSALMGNGVDNAIVELDANEPPIADGSAREFAKIIQQAGLLAQNEARETLVVDTPMEFQMGETLMTVFPHDSWKITCVSSDKQGRFTQHFSVEITPETMRKEVLDARTFCFYEEIELLIKNGLIKGGSLENAVVIRDDAILTTEPLRFTNEFVRHKILDIVGDLSLLGRPIKGHIIAVKPSHSANCELARRLNTLRLKPIVAQQTFSPPPMPVKQVVAPEAPVIKDGVTLDIDQLMRILPHRYPFLMVDRIIKVEGNRVVGIKNVTINEPFFQGHFPQFPIMPGVLQLEAIAQVAGILMLREAENLGKIAYFMSADKVKWRRPVRPGDTLTIDVEMVKFRGKIGKAKGVCYVGEDIVSEAEFTVMIGDALESRSSAKAGAAAKAS